MDPREECQLVLDHAPVMVWRTDRDGTPRFVNATARTFTGLTDDALRPDLFLGAAHRDDRERVRGVRREAFAARRPFEVEYRLLRADGAHRIVLERAQPMIDGGGAFVGFVGTCMDVHERATERAAGQESKRERQRLHDVLMQVPVPFAMLRGPNHVYEFANAHHDALMRRAGVVGRALVEVFPEAVGSPLLEVLDHVFATGQPFTEGELSFPLQRDGELKETIFKLAVDPLRDERGVIEGLMVVGVEVTEQVLARWELGAALNTQKKLEAVRERLLGIVGHDLRNPLSTITVAAHMLLKQDAMPEGQVKILRRIVTSADRMARMISDILDFTQGRLGGGLPIARKPVDLHLVAREAVEELEVGHPGRAIHFDAEGDGHGQLDPDRMTQVLSNLVSNALQYGPEDQPVSVTLRGRGEHLELEVHNMGPPIGADALPHIFDPFLRATESGRANRTSRGLGLGLYIVEQIVLAHGGTIEVSSSVEQGTRFVVRVPRVTS